MGGVLLVPAITVLIEPVVASESGEGAMGNLKSEKAGDGAPGEVMESMFGVLGMEGCWKGDSLPGG